MSRRKNKNSDSESDTENYEYEKEVNIRELDLNDLPPSSVNDITGGYRFIIIGKGGSGKSSIIKSILYAKKHILQVGHVFSGTEEENGFFKQFIPDTFIFNGLDSTDLTHLEKFKTRQTYAIKYLEAIGGNSWAFELIDDCTYDSKMFKHPIWHKIYKNGRHWRMLHGLSLHKCMNLDSAIRGLFDGVFICRETEEEERHKLWKNFGGSAGTFQEFKELMDRLTDDFTAIYIKTRSQSNKMEDNVFFFKADLSKIPKDWKIGSKDYWAFHNERYNDKQENLVFI